MADTAVVITQGTGTNIDTRTEATNGNHRQVVVLGDPATNAGVAPVDATAGLKVDLGADNDITGTVTANLGATDNAVLDAMAASLDTLDSVDFATQTTLAAIKAKTDNIPAQGQALAAASVPIVLTAAQITTLTPPAAITGFSTAAAQTDKSQFTKITDGTDTALVTAAGEVNVIATAQPGVDIGDVTINNAAGGSAVNIQDGGNSITIDGTVAVTGVSTLAEQQTQTTSLQLIDDAVFTDDTSTHATGTTKGLGIMAVAAPTDTALNANDIGMPGMTVNREMYASVTTALPAGTNAIGKLAANSGVDIGDVDVTSVTPGTAAGNLGKAEDAAHASGDTGVFILGVRNDNATTTYGADQDYGPIATDLKGRVSVRQIASTATLSNVSGSASSVTVLAANSARVGGSIYNDSSAIVYLKFGATASTTSFTVKLAADTYYEIPGGYTGIIDGIWASATGSARVTELT